MRVTRARRFTGSKIAGLDLPFILRDAPPDPFRILITPGDLGSGPGGDPVKVEIARPGAQRFRHRADAPDQLKVIRRAAGREAG